MKKNLLFIGLGIIVAGGLFYGGMKYGQASNLQANSFGTRGGANFANLSPEERQQRFQQMGAMAGNGANGRQQRGNILSGEILSKDDKSMSIKLPDGGSKLIFYSSSTPIMKAVSATSEDLQVGTQILANGSSTSDGSMNAQNIQIRTAGAADGMAQANK